MKIQPANRQWAFTLMDGLIWGALILLPVAFLLTALAPIRCTCQKVNCVNNLKQVGIAFRIWEGDNNDQYPMDVSVTNGGARELVATGNVAACFQVMSNELATPKILACPEDNEHQYATNFDSAFSRVNVSYFLGWKAKEIEPREVLSGDSDLVLKGRRVAAGIVALGTNVATWTRDRHAGSGNVLMMDGSVQTEREIGCASANGAYFVTNSVVVP